MKKPLALDTLRHHVSGAIARGEAEAIVEQPVVVETVDMTPTWGEIGNIAKRLAASKETKALMTLWPDVARAMAACQALQNITKTLTDEQRSVVSKTMVAELTKQGY